MEYYLNITLNNKFFARVFADVSLHENATALAEQFRSRFKAEDGFEVQIYRETISIARVG